MEYTEIDKVMGHLLEIGDIILTEDGTPTEVTGIDDGGDAIYLDLEDGGFMEVPPFSLTPIYGAVYNVEV